ncbi:hypothetical protein ACT29H_05555 [Thermophagus sp. OGC60D27]
MILVSVLLAGGCASKKYMNKALELEEAGLFTEAADFYFRALQSKRDNIDAKVGLKRTGQLVLNQKTDQFMSFYRNDQYKDAVYAFLEATAYQGRAKVLGVDLNISESTGVYFKEVKEIFLNEQYGKAVTFLEAENFSEALTLLTEILKIEPGYRDASQHWVTARYEPVYRQGQAYLKNDRFRSAYYAFEEILAGTDGYKSAAELKDYAREKALIRIGVLSYYASGLTQKNVAEELKSQIIAGITKQQSPFYEIVEVTQPDRTDNALLLFKEIFIDKKSSSISLPSNVDAVLSCKINDYRSGTSSLKMKKRKAWLKTTVNLIDENGIEEKVIEYKKVYYYEYSQNSYLNMNLSYSLVDVDSKKIMVSDLIQKQLKDEVKYASYEGDYRDLIPGTWYSISSSSDQDKRYEDKTSVDKFQALFVQRKKVVSDFDLKKQAMSELSDEIAQKVIAYNPEI